MHSRYIDESPFRAKPLERERAIALRKLGFSYSEIRSRVPVAKSTPSVWFRTVGLSKPQQQRITKLRVAAGRRGAKKLHEEKPLRVRDTVDRAGDEARKLLADQEMRWAIGTALYWAEGAKAKEWNGNERFAFANMDPQMIVLVRTWLVRYCSVDPPDIIYSLYIHRDSDIPSAQEFWAGNLGVDKSVLHTYLKKNNPKTCRKNRGELYHGTMRVTVRKSVYLSHRIVGWIQTLVAYCGVG